MLLSTLIYFLYVLAAVAVPFHTVVFLKGVLSFMFYISSLINSKIYSI